MTGRVDRSLLLKGFLIDGDHGLLIFDSQIFVTIAPSGVSTITGTHNTFLNDFGSNRFQIVSPTNFGKEINEGGGQVHRVVAPFGGLVVPGEDMMIVVPAFTESKSSDQGVFSRVDGPKDMQQRTKFNYTRCSIA